MKFIRAVERGSIGELSLCLHLYPNISRYITNPYATNVNVTTHLATLKDHAIELARTHAIAELACADDLDAEGQAERSRRRRQKAIRLLFRLAPGRSGAIGAIRCGGGQLVTDPDNMARVLRQYWADIFRSRGG